MVWFIKISCVLIINIVIINTKNNKITETKTITANKNSQNYTISYNRK